MWIYCIENETSPGWAMQMEVRPIIQLGTCSGPNIENRNSQTSRPLCVGFWASFISFHFICFCFVVFRFWSIFVGAFTFVSFSGRKKPALWGL